MDCVAARVGLVMTMAACLGGVGDGAGKGGPTDIRGFRPSANGFAFANHFEGSPLPGALGTLGGGVGKSLGAPTTYGLCGGMSFVAADFYLAGRAMPARTSQPGRGEALYDYIQKRQIDSVGPGMVLAGRFGRWMGLPDDGPIGVRRLSAADVEEAAATVDRGEPAVLGLVFNRHPGNKESKARAGVPWENHQVLGYDVRRDGKGAGAVVFKIYDPNYPKADDAVIACRTVVAGEVLVAPWGGWSVPVMGVECERRVGTRSVTPVRGVIAMPYTETAPPEGME